MKPLQALIDINQMRDYRIMGVGAMSQITSAQAELVGLVFRCAKDGSSPTANELQALMWRYAAALRTIDFAHKFLVVHGKPVRDADAYEAMRNGFIPQVRHRPATLQTGNVIPFPGGR